MGKIISNQNLNKKKFVIFFFVGLFNTFIDFIIYTIATLVFGTPVTLATVLSGTISSISTFFTHGKITWQNQNLNKSSFIRFAVWCLIMVTMLRPFVAFVAEQLTPLYQFAFTITSFLHIPFSYNFVRNTGIFVIIAAVVMILNFTIYEKVVFKQKVKTPSLPKSEK